MKNGYGVLAFLAADLLGIVIGLGLILAGLSGCSSGNGWKVEFGIVPINQVSDTKQLSKGAK